MAIDFSKIRKSTCSSIDIDPIKIYDNLDRKTQTGPLREIQKNILNKWFNEKKLEKDLIIKLHTGAGKTLIGLLILQSRINESRKPCIYLTPNIQLANQVYEEASKFGFKCVLLKNQTELPNSFVEGKEILITHVQKFFNGKSIFKRELYDEKIDTILIDDSHSCIDAIKKSFTISISRTDCEDLFNSILELFEYTLSEQQQGTFKEIKLNKNTDDIMYVPYWSWYDKQQDMQDLLLNYIERNEIKFPWDFLKNKFDKCQCLISSKLIEISPYKVDADQLGVYKNAQHRILMSATTQDDSFFIKSLNISANSVTEPLIDESHKWSGEKLILIPSLIDERLKSYDITYALGSDKFNKDSYGVVSLVPSEAIANNYKRFGANILNKDNITEEIKKLKEGQFSQLVVIINRYDGIDLPDESCRILIMDGLPAFVNLSEQYDYNCCPNSQIANKSLAQKIEQGMGRAVRGEKDFCVIFLIGKNLVNFLRSKNLNFLSEQTRKQIEIGQEIAKSIEIDINDLSQNINVSINNIIDILKKVLVNRDNDWKSLYKEKMESIKLDKINKSDSIKRLVIEKKCEDLFYKNDFRAAYCEMNGFITSIQDDEDKGWFKQILARYAFYDRQIEQYRAIQKKAYELNDKLLKPQGGISYKKLSLINQCRCKNTIKYIDKFNSNLELHQFISNEIENLSFAVNSNKFENALDQLGRFLGFNCERPDHKYGRGPDNLWEISNDEYLFFECKNQVEQDRKAIYKKETGQMNNHIAWFKNNYGESVKFIPIMIIRTNIVDKSADFDKEVVIMKGRGLNTLKKNLSDLLISICSQDIKNLNEAYIQECYTQYKFNYSDFMTLYTEKFIKQNN